MATTTTSNYGWVIPQNDELVSNGAAAIRTLGNAADTSLKTVSDGRGLVHINTTSFSGVNGQSISDVFSATYVNYKVVINIDTVGSSDELNFRMRVSGADNTSANYKWQKMTLQNTGSFGGAGSGASVLDTKFNAASVSGTYTSFVTLEFFNPFATDNTGIISLASYFDGLGNHATTYAGGLMSVTTSYTGFTFYTNAAGNMSGTVRVYGYKN